MMSNSVKKDVFYIHVVIGTLVCYICSILNPLHFIIFITVVIF